MWGWGAVSGLKEGVLKTSFKWVMLWPGW